MRRPLRSLAALACLVAMASARTGAGDGYVVELERWRAEREARLRAEGGWLSVVGLFWLEEGASRFGTDPSAEIVLPAGTAPALAGAFEHHGGTTEVRLEPGVSGTLSGRPVSRAVLRPDSGDILRLGRLTLQVIERGGRFGIRLKDADSPARREFEGLRWFPVRESYRVTARFQPAPPGKTLPIPNVLGQVNHLPSPGRAVFQLEGRQVALEPVLEEADATELFFIFRDATSGRETYGAGRFLYTEMPEDGRVVLDFNRAYSPPCAFTDYATCPLPPPQNRLPVRIEAGELAGRH